MSDKLFLLFKKVFTTDYRESAVNPRFSSGEDFLLITKVFLAILKFKNIDFWKAFAITPSWMYELHPDDVDGEPSYEIGDINYRRANTILRNAKEYTKLVEEYDGNPIFDNIFYSYFKIDEDGEFGPVGKKYWQIDHIAYGNEMPYHILAELSIFWQNKTYGTSFSIESWQNDLMDDLGENDTSQYFCLMAYFQTWIDRFAHQFIFTYSANLEFSESSDACAWRKSHRGDIPYHLLTKNCNIDDESLIPEGEKSNVIFYDGVPYYDWENDLYLRNNCKTFDRKDFNSVKDIPSNLRVCWEFFKQCESCLSEFYPMSHRDLLNRELGREKDIKSKRRNKFRL